MLVLSNHTGTTTKNIEFTGKISSIIMRCYNASSYGTLGDIKAVLYIHSPSSGKRYTAFDNVKLIRLAELCSMDKESSIKVSGTGTLVEAAPNTISASYQTCEFKVDLTADGKGILLAPGEKWMMEITGLTAGDTYNIWAVESSETTTLPIKYDVFATGSLTNQKFNLAGADRIFLESGGSLTNVEIADAFGNIKKELSELSAEIRNGYGAVWSQTMTTSGLISTYSINEGLYGYLFPFDGKNELQVNCTGAASLEVIAMRW